MLSPAQATALAGDAAPGVDDALSVVAGLDRGLVDGFARLTEERAAALSALAGAFARTSLAGRLAEATEKLAAGSITDEHVAALAGGRTALLGAVHDALLDHLDTVLGRSREPWATPPQVSGPEPVAARAASRAWLRELAIAGWRGVDHELASGASQIVAAAQTEPAQTEPGLRGLGVLLDGLMAELRASAPVAAMRRVPARRWGDLWARAVLLSQDTLPGPGEAVSVSGRLLLLGLEVHEHGTAVRLRVHAVLTTAANPARLVRTGISVAKVDSIVGPAIWPLCQEFPILLRMLAERRAVEISDWPLLPGGRLLWREDRAELGEPVDPFVTARVELAGALAAAVPPLERHPVAIAEPVLVEKGSVLGLDVESLPSAGPLTAEAVAASSACLGVLGWDGGAWSLRPLAIETMVKKKRVGLHNGDWALGVGDAKAAKATATDAVPVLRERAGRLLRR